MLLAHEESIRIVGEASDGHEAFRLIADAKPDVVVTDIQMPKMDGIELTRELKQSYPNIPVIALTQFKEDHLIVEMLEAGAKGYLLKSSNKENLMEAIQAVHAGGWFYCDSTSLKLAKMIAASKVKVPTLPENVAFNDTEIQIIRLICQQLSTREIAAAVHLGERTVESYRHKIFDKTGVRNMAGLAIYAVRNGLFHP